MSHQLRLSLRLHGYEHPRHVLYVRGDVVSGVRQHDVRVRHIRKPQHLATRARESSSAQGTSRKTLNNPAVLDFKGPASAHTAFFCPLVRRCWVVAASVEAGIRSRRVSGERIVYVLVTQSTLVEADDEGARIVDAGVGALEVRCSPRRYSREGQCHQRQYGNNAEFPH